MLTYLSYILINRVKIFRLNKTLAKANLSHSLKSISQQAISLTPLVSKFYTCYETFSTGLKSVGSKVVCVCFVIGPQPTKRNKIKSRKCAFF